MKTIIVENRRFGDGARLGCLLLLPVALALLLTGCLSKPALVTQSFALQTPAVSGTALKADGPVLALRPVQVSPLFAGQALVYRIGPNEYETDPYAGFLVPPAQIFADSLRGYLANSGLFAGVTDSGGLVPAGQFLQVDVDQLYGDFQNLSQPAAVLSLRLTLLDSHNGIAGKVVFQKEYSRNLSIQKNTAAALVAGWDQALGDIITQFASDLSATSQSGNSAAR